MPSPASTRNAYVWVNVLISFGGVYIPCNMLSIARDAEDQWVQTTDVHGTAVHSYISNMSATATAEIPMNQRDAITYLGGFATAADSARRAGGNPGVASPLLPFGMLDPASGSKVVSTLARVAGFPNDISFDESGEKMRTFKFLLTDCFIEVKGYAA